MKTFLAENPGLFLIALLYLMVVACLIVVGGKAIIDYFNPEAVEDRRLHDAFAQAQGYRNYRAYIKNAREIGDCDAGIDEKDGFGVWVATRYDERNKSATA